MSDNIAVTNQVPCRNCLENGNEFCFHYDLIDPKLIREAQEELSQLEEEKLVMKVKRMCEATVPHDVWDNSNMCPWDQMYNCCPLHLVPVGISPGMFDNASIEVGR
jgi:hypothetical protein